MFYMSMAFWSGEHNLVCYRTCSNSKKMALLRHLQHLHSIQNLVSLPWWKVAWGTSNDGMYEGQSSIKVLPTATLLIVHSTSLSSKLTNCSIKIFKQYCFHEWYKLNDFPHITCLGTSISTQAVIIDIIFSLIVRQQINLLWGMKVCVLLEYIDIYCMTC